MQTKTTGKILAALALALIANAGWAAGDDMAAKKDATMWTASELKWEPMAPGSPLQVAPLWGDRAVGEHGMLLKLPAGFEAGLHSHTLDYNAVCLQGNWVHSDEGKPGKQLGLMSYVMQPGKANHNDVCKGPEDCIILVHQTGAADFIPVPKPADNKMDKMEMKKKKK